MFTVCLLFKYCYLYVGVICCAGVCVWCTVLVCVRPVAMGDRSTPRHLMLEFHPPAIAALKIGIMPKADRVPRFSYRAVATLSPPCSYLANREGTSPPHFRAKKSHSPINQSSPPDFLAMGLTVLVCVLC